MAEAAENSPVKTEQKPKVVLYWLDKSRSQRILWLLEELNVEYELKTYKREKMLAPEELKQIHPLGKAPIVSIQAAGMSKPLILAESGLIIEYLVGHFGPRLVPKRYAEGREGQVGGETEEWMRYRYYMHYGEGSIMPFLLIAVIMGNIQTNSPFFIKPISNAIVKNVNSMLLEPNFKTHFGFLESQITTSPHGGQYLCGTELTGADIMMSFPLGAAKGRVGFSKEKHPKLWAYVERLESREAYKKAVQKIIDVEGFYDPTL